MNTYTGTTLVSGGTLKAGVASVAGVSGAFGNNSAVTLTNTAGVTLDITGFNTQIGSLTGGGASGGNVTLGAATLTVGGNNENTTYGGIISGANGVLTKTGTGVLTLTGANTYTGGTNINGGFLDVNSTTAVANATAITFGGGGIQWSPSITSNTVNLYDVSSNHALTFTSTALFDTNDNLVALANSVGNVGAAGPDEVGPRNADPASATPTPARRRSMRERCDWRTSRRSVPVRPP